MRFVRDGEKHGRGSTSGRIGFLLLIAVLTSQVQSFTVENMGASGACPVADYQLKCACGKLLVDVENGSSQEGEEASYARSPS
jgi:hypothetical protein